MKLLVRILISIVVLLLLAVALVYIDGSTLPVDHTTTVAGTIAAPPEKVFARIVDVAGGPSWRPAVQKVTVLPSDNGRDHWIEDLGHGQTMTFLAINTVAPTRREVLLDVPGATYGGTWTYDVSPGTTSGTTTLRITESGFIHPPVYRFMMRHVFGMTYNLDHYIHDMQAAVTH
jgi:uncharacterized protein YndB with AHSA1/START domain